MNLAFSSNTGVHEFLSACGRSVGFFFWFGLYFVIFSFIAFPLNILLLIASLLLLFFWPCSLSVSFCSTLMPCLFRSFPLLTLAPIQKHFTCRDPKFSKPVILQSKILSVVFLLLNRFCVYKSVFTSPFLWTENQTWSLLSLPLFCSGSGTT